MEIEEETDRFRAERAEAETAQIREELDDSKARPYEAGPEDRDTSQDKQNELELSLMREIKKSSETYDLLETSRRETKKLKRRLSAIKRDLADGKPVEDVLAQHYGCGVRQAALGIQDRG